MDHLFLFVFLLVAVGLLVWGFAVYNKLVALNQAVKNSWAQITVHLKLRHDLVPNLVASVQGLMTHERETLEAVVAARAAAAAPLGTLPTADELKREGEFGQVLSRFVALTESYPALTANTAVKDLMEQLSTTERQIGFARQGYNDSVEILNTRLESIPDTWVNSWFLRLAPAPYWEVDADQRAKMEEAPPTVAFGNRP
jgi:LemA protein